MPSANQSPAGFGGRGSACNREGAMSDHYILDGHETVACDLLTWGRWLQENDEVRIVKKDTVGESLVSTVFLGLNHSFGEGPPLLFETLVFKGPLADEMDRYSTWEEAERGHATMVERVQEVS